MIKKMKKAEVEEALHILTGMLIGLKMEYTNASNMNLEKYEKNFKRLCEITGQDGDFAVRSKVGEK